jgi:hypothetical protein
MMTESLRVDAARVGLYGSTGIMVRAQKGDGSWVTADIADLTVESLNAWLRSRGGDNEWAEQVVRHLLGHRPTP